MKKTIRTILLTVLVLALSASLFACASYNKKKPSKQPGFVSNAADGKYWVDLTHEYVKEFHPWMYGEITMDETLYKNDKGEMFGDLARVEIIKGYLMAKAYTLHGIKFTMTVDEDVEWEVKVFSPSNGSAEEEKVLAETKTVSYQKGVAKEVEFVFPVTVDFDNYTLNKNKVAIEWCTLDGEETKGIYKTVSNVQLLLKQVK